MTFKNPCSALLAFRGEINLAPVVLAEAGQGDGSGAIKPLSCKDLGSAADPTPEQLPCVPASISFGISGHEA